MFYQDFAQQPQSRSLPLLHAIAAARHMALAACCLLIGSGCATLPDAAREMETPHTQVVAFEGARGPVSAARSDAIIEKLQSKSGDIDILQKHLAMEQAINADSPLVLGNNLTLLQDGPATYQAMFAAMREAKDHINLETYIFEDDEIGKQFADLLLEQAGRRRPGQPDLRQRRLPEHAQGFLRAPARRRHPGARVQSGQPAGRE